MSNALFPVQAGQLRGLAYTVKKTPTLNTLIQTSANHYENRIAQMNNPIWTWTLIFEYLYSQAYAAPIAANLVYGDLETLMGFFLARQGQFDDFLYLDPTDNSVGPGLIAGVPNQAARLPLVTDGTFYYTPLQRPIGGLTSAWNDGSRFFEDITDLNGALSVWANGVAKTGGGIDYTLLGPGLAIPGYSYMGRYIKWQAMPAEPITATFNFYFRVRFKTDDMDFEEFMNNLWTLGDKGKNGRGYLELITARPVTQ